MVYTLVGILDDDFVEIEKLAKELNCISTRVAYMESVSIDSITRYLDDADILSTKKHFEDLDKFRAHVGKMSALESLHCTDLLKIQDTLKKQERSASKKVATADATTTGVTTAVSRTSTLTLQMPTFDGTIIGWKSFWNLFSSKIEREPDLSDADKSCLLLNAFVNPESKSLAQGAIGSTKTFEEALIIIRELFENNRILFRHHYECFHQAERFSCKVEDIVKLKTDNYCSQRNGGS